jgi:hypothetical protein
MSLRKVHEDAIRAGKTVFIRGKHYNSVAALPTEADLSVGDTKKEEATAAQIKLDIENLKRELEKVESKKAEIKEVAQSEAKSAAKSEEKSEDKAEHKAAPKAEAKSDAKK